jgi:hypothetical protein
VDHYAPPAPYDQRQVRIWKRTEALVDLATTGGHEVRFEGRRVCPARFILKHYPIRGQRHGERKIFDERLGRFSSHERARGWHVQYDAVVRGQSLIRDRASLVRYDPEALRLALALTQAPAAALEQDLLSVRADLTLATQRHETDRMALNEALCQVRVTRAELALRERERDELSSQLDGLRDRLEAAEGQVETGRARVDETRRLLETVRVDLAEERQRRGELEHQTTAARAAITELQHENHSLRYQLDDIRRSLSWRWTAPVRWALRGLGRPR